LNERREKENAYVVTCRVLFHFVGQLGAFAAVGGLVCIAWFENPAVALFTQEVRNGNEVWMVEIVVGAQMWAYVLSLYRIYQIMANLYMYHICPHLSTYHYLQPSTPHSISYFLCNSAHCWILKPCYTTTKPPTAAKAPSWPTKWNSTPTGKHKAFSFSLLSFN